MSKNRCKTSLNYVAYRNREAQQGITKKGANHESVGMPQQLKGNKNLQEEMKINWFGKKTNQHRRSQSTLPCQIISQKQKKQERRNDIGINSFIRSKYERMEESHHAPKNPQAGKKQGTKLRNRSICKMLSLESFPECVPFCVNDVSSIKVENMKEDSSVGKEDLLAVKENLTAVKENATVGKQEQSITKQGFVWEARQIMEELAELILNQNEKKTEPIASSFSPPDGTLQTEISSIAFHKQTIASDNFVQSLFHNQLPAGLLPKRSPPESLIPTLNQQSVQDGVQQKEISKNSSTPCFIHREQECSKEGQFIKSDEELTAQTVQIYSQFEGVFERSKSKGGFIRSGQMGKSKSRTKLQMMLMRFKTRVNE